MGHEALTIRSARSADAGAIAQVDVESWNAGFGRRIGMKAAGPDEAGRWRGEIGRSGRSWWVAERADVVVGFAGVGASRDPCRQVSVSSTRSRSRPEAGDPASAGR